MSSVLTCVDEELVGNTRVVDVMNDAGKDGGKHLKVVEHVLQG